MVPGTVRTKCASYHPFHPEHPPQALPTSSPSAFRAKSAFVLWGAVTFHTKRLPLRREIYLTPLNSAVFSVFLWFEDVRIPLIL